MSARGFVGQSLLEYRGVSVMCRYQSYEILFEMLGQASPNEPAVRKREQKSRAEASEPAGICISTQPSSEKLHNFTYTIVCVYTVCMSVCVGTRVHA